MTDLPDDILHMVCTQLRLQRDFNTLFNCACSGKQLASIALTNLYRTHYIAPITDAYIPGLWEDINRDSDEEIEEEIRKKRAGLWRAIILSSLGKTFYPYSRYIRTLNLQDLEKLFNSCCLGTTVTARISKNQQNFFKGELAQFSDVPLGLDTSGIIDRIGEVMTKQTPLVEELITDVHSEVLSRWIPRLPRLERLKSSHGISFAGNGKLVQLHCPSFTTLHFSKEHSPIGGRDLAAFLNDLRPQSLKSFETFGDYRQGHEIFKALSCHGDSLINLKLHDLEPENMTELPLLKDCTNLVSLSLALAGRGTNTAIQKAFDNVLLDIVAWLKECTMLRNLAFKDLKAIALLIPILLQDSIHLTSLKHESCFASYTQIFYQALANQTSLQSLWLEGSLFGSGDSQAEITDNLVESVTKMVNLTELRLTKISMYFDDRHIVQIASSLPKLEFWSTSGLFLTDAIWGEVACLRSLRTLVLRSMPSFTADGIIDFLEKLGAGNKGLSLLVWNEGSLYSYFSLVERDMIQKRFAEMTEGRFESFPLTYYENETSSCESDSD